MTSLPSLPYACRNKNMRSWILDLGLACNKATGTEEIKTFQRGSTVLGYAQAPLLGIQWYSTGLQLAITIVDKDSVVIPRRVWRSSRRAKERTTPSGKRTADKSLITTLNPEKTSRIGRRTCLASRNSPAGLALPSVATSGRLWRTSHYRRSANTRAIQQLFLVYLEYRDIVQLNFGTRRPVIIDWSK